MKGYNLVLDLLKLGTRTGVNKPCLATLTGPGGVPFKAICIPTEEGDISFGLDSSGRLAAKLKLTAYEMREPSKYGATHFLKQSISKDAYDKLTEEQRKELPILGDVYPIKPRTCLRSS